MGTMGISFSGAEIVEMAIEIEKNGRAFYREMGKNSRDAKAKELFLFLVDEEQKHLERFRQMLERVKSYEPPEAYPQEYFAYMSALVGGQVFTQKDKGAELAARVKSDKEGMEMAITAEKDSILLYEGLKKLVPQQEIGLVDDVIREEQAHLAQLTSMIIGVRS